MSSPTGSSTPGPFRGVRGARASGFTLVEILAALALLALVFAVVVPRAAVVLGGPDPVLAARELLSVLRQARGEAIASGRETTVVIDLAARTFGSADGRRRSLREGLQVRVDTVAGERIDEAVAGIRFHPDGSSTGGRVLFAHGGREVAVDIAWLTGRVTLHE